VRFDRVHVGEAALDLGVVEIRDPDEDASRRALVPLDDHPRVLERLPGDLEGETLLRVHVPGLAWRDPEERGIEPVDLLDEPTVARIGLAGRSRVGIVERVDVPPVARHLGDGVGSLAEETPERCRIDGAARESAADSDDGDRVAAAIESRRGGRREERRGGTAIHDAVLRGAGVRRTVPARGMPRAEPGRSGL